jgi:hypothetical protein
MSENCKHCMGSDYYHSDDCAYYPKKPKRQAHKPSTSAGHVGSSDNGRKLRSSLNRKDKQ